MHRNDWPPGSSRTTPWFYARSPVAIWFKVPGGGLLMHSTCWAPTLVDYAALATHDTSTLRGLDHRRGLHP